MGLMDIVGGVLGGGQGGGNPNAALLNAVVGMLSNNSQVGGLGGLVEQFQRSGLGDVVGSWVGTGQNLPISAEQLKSALPADVLGGLLQQVGGGTSQGDLLGSLAQMLPQVVDQLTPQGQVPSGGLGDVAGMLGQLLKR